VHMVAARLGFENMLVNEWVWSKSRHCLLRPEVDMGAFRAWTEMEIRCVKGMCGLKVV